MALDWELLEGARTPPGIYAASAFAGPAATASMVFWGPYPGL